MNIDDIFDEYQDCLFESIVYGISIELINYKLFFESDFNRRQAAITFFTNNKYLIERIINVIYGKIKKN